MTHKKSAIFQELFFGLHFLERGRGRRKLFQATILRPYLVCILCVIMWLLFFNHTITKQPLKRTSGFKLCLFDCCLLHSDFLPVSLDDIFPLFENVQNMEWWLECRTLIHIITRQRQSCIQEYFPTIGMLSLSSIQLWHVSKSSHVYNCCDTRNNSLVSACKVFYLIPCRVQLNLE